jgi:enoyl-CoA hydratase/carnithine racemase
LTARQIDAPEALALGLITGISETPLRAARDMATGFAQISPDVLRAGKHLVDLSWTAPPGAGLRIEAELQAGLIGGLNQIEAVMAGMAKRAPRYSG